MSENGRLSPNEIVHVDGAPFYVHTAAAYRAAQKAAKRAGVTLRIINACSAYRDGTLQSNMIAHPGKYGVGKVNGHFIKQAPVGHSTHGGGDTGFAIDVIEGREWLIAHGNKFGFTRTNPDGDPNHFHHDSVTSIHSTSIASVGAAIQALAERSTTMPKILKLTTKAPGKPTLVQYFNVSDPVCVVEVTKAEAKVYNAANGYLLTKPVSTKEITAYRNMAAKIAAAHQPVRSRANSPAPIAGKV